MKTFLLLIASALFLAPNAGWALMEIAEVSAEGAREMGIEVRSHAAGPEAVRVEVEFHPAEVLKGFTRADLEMRGEGKLLLVSSLREETLGSGRVVVSFAVDRSKLELMTLRLVVRRSERGLTGYELRVKDFVAR